VLTPPLAERCKEGESVPVVLRESDRVALVQALALVVREGERVTLGLSVGVRAGLRLAARGGEGEEALEMENEGEGVGVRGAVGEREREGERERVGEALGERVVEALQVEGKMVPGSVQAPGQGQGKGAGRPGVGQ
jgi:hypothetical protein